LNACFVNAVLAAANDGKIEFDEEEDDEEDDENGDGILVSCTLEFPGFELLPNKGSGSVCKGGGKF